MAGGDTLADEIRDMLADEIRDTLSAARETLAELSEEGVEGWQPLPDESQTAPQAEAPDAPRAAAPAVQAERPPPPQPAEAPPTAAGEPDPLGLARPPHPWPENPSLPQVREALGECTRCPLHDTRTQIVFGDGNPEADLMFVGEGPGEQEDLRGIPFCGRAGDLLTSMIEKGLEISRSSVYICNIVKCRPPKNRTPLANEVSACRPFLDGQIEAVRPRVIVTLGKPATSTLLGHDVAITRLRGTWQEYRGIPLMPTFHPAFLLRQYTADNRRKVWEDLKAALALARSKD